MPSLKALKRSGVLYISHVVTTVTAIALFCVAALLFAHPGYLDDSIVYMNIKPIFDDPVRGFPGIVGAWPPARLFQHPADVHGAPRHAAGMMWLAKRGLSLLLGCSIALYLLAGWFVIDMPNFPKEGGWFFNPFAWQILFVDRLHPRPARARGKVFAYNPWIFWASVALSRRRLIWTWFDCGLSARICRSQDLLGFRQDLCRLPAALPCAGARLCGDDVALGQWMKRIPATQSSHRHGPAFAAGLLRRLAAVDGRRDRAP